MLTTTEKEKAKLYFRDATKLIFKGLEKMGLDINDPNFTDTPNRVAKAFLYIFSGVSNTEEQVKEILKTSFPSPFSEMVIEKNIHVYSMCPHHLLPVEYEISVAYIPGSNGRVLGISKLARLVDVLAKRPVLQEQFVDEITEALMSIGSKGSACVVNGAHFCMKMRGVRQFDSITTISSVKGVFDSNSTARQELMSLIGNK